MLRLLAVCVAAHAAELGTISVDPETGHFVDSYGRVRLFHGVNAVLKESPWMPQTDHFTTDSLDSKTMDFLQEWGFNVVRLGVMWPGVEPTPGQVDESYLQRVGQLSRDLAQRSIYTIADLHQDLGSRYFCGEGVPEAYVEELLQDPKSQMFQAPQFPHPFPDNLPRNASGFPELDRCLGRSFFEYYSTYQVGALFSELYRSGSKLHDGFLRFWKAVSNEFKDASHLLGYELLNEPSGSCLKASDLFGCRLRDRAMPLRFNNHVEAYYLMPLYQAAASVIRGNGAKQVIFYEGTVWPKLGVDVFPEPALGRDPQQALSYHIYCAPGDGDSWPAGLLCDAAQSIFENTYYPFLHKYGMPGFMTEFGAVRGNHNEVKHISNLLNAADKHMQSWTYWQLKRFDDFTTTNTGEAIFTRDGKVEVNKLSALSRTYAQAIAGKPLHMDYDFTKRTFALDFVATVKDAPTEIYLNEELHYPTGYGFSASPPGCLTVSEKRRNYLHLSLANDRCMGAVIQIRINPSDMTMV